MSRPKYDPTRFSQYARDLAKAVSQMSALELKDALRGTPGSENLTISYATNGNQIIHMGDKTIEVGPMASNGEIIAALQNPFIKPENTMSITGAGFLAENIKAKIQAAKDRMAASANHTETALKKLNDAADHADLVSRTIEAEADALTAELGQFSNGGPA